MERPTFTEFEMKLMEGTDLEKHFTKANKDLAVSVNIVNKQDKSVESSNVKVIANIDGDIKQLLDNISDVTGIKKCRIIEDGIKSECERLKEKVEKGERIW